LGVLLKARQNELIPALEPLIQTLQQNGIRLGDEVIAEVLRLAGED